MLFSQGRIKGHVQTASHIDHYEPLVSSYIQKQSIFCSSVAFVEKKD
jgi:hypothetical protein